VEGKPKKNIKYLVISMHQEREIQIPIFDNKTLFGTFTRSEKPSKKLVIFAHGLFGHQNDHIFFNGSHAFAKSGIDSYRFDFYSGRKGARTFSDSPVSLQVADLATVVKHFSKKYPDITIVAHSMGAYVALFWNRAYKNSVKRFVLLDPSWEPKQIFGGLSFSKKLDAYILKDRTDTIIQKSIVEEAQKLPDIKELVQKITAPLLIIAAEKGARKIAEESYFNNASCLKKFVVLETDHNFNDKEAGTKLFKETISWIKK
jgi:pimeloyl-ACP methyl ester carboxylesterase